MVQNTQKGFTLIELLVVIAIIAILSVVVILTLNPAELLKQARDSNRASDLATLKSALSLYMADVSSPTLAPTYGNCMTSSASTSSNCGFTGTYTAVGSTSQAVAGLGWLSVNFTAISSGAPIGQLPIDPLNNSTGSSYRYVATSSPILAFEIDATMESSKYSNTSTGLVATDGGNNTSVYEVGTDAGLDL